MDALVDDLHALVGDSLRSVGEYHNADHTRLYRREDVKLNYDPDDVDKIFEDLALQGLSRTYLEDLFEAGTLECVMFRFEDALMFHLTASDRDGLFVTIDSDAEVDLAAFVDTCNAHLEP